jgi:CheY-like chemotaxis protein
MQLPAFRILLVEDDADDRYIMHQAFSELGFDEQVRMFGCGRDLTEYLSQLSPALFPKLIVLDYNMPAINGAELALFLRQHASYCHIPVVLYSTGMSPRLQQELLRNGVLRCYEKGMEYADVLKLARSFEELSKENPGMPAPAVHGIRFESVSES